MGWGEGEGGDMMCMIVWRDDDVYDRRYRMWDGVRVRVEI